MANNMRNNITPNKKLVKKLTHMPTINAKMIDTTTKAPIVTLQM
jgi:hypothetical protein